MPFLNSVRASFGAEGRMTSVPLSVLPATAFSYTGGIQTYTPVVTGTYTLELYGAAGGDSTGKGYACDRNYGTGGQGGYLKIRTTLVAGQTYYVVVGGRGNDHTTQGSVSGGYNGGGGSSGTNSNGGGGGGGGATHIATATGTLQSLSGNTASVIAVAGAGAGAWGTSYTWADYRSLSDGGAGGGLEGQRGGYGGTRGYTTNCSYNNIYNQNDSRSQAYNFATGGTQSSPGYQATASGSLSYMSHTVGGFGYGATSNNAGSHSGGGGGAGWYGGAGGASGENANGGGGGGGSSYAISGSTIVVNQQGGRTGNGYVLITPGII